MVDPYKPPDSRGNHKAEYSRKHALRENLWRYAKSFFNLKSLLIVLSVAVVHFYAMVFIGWYGAEMKNQTALWTARILGLPLLTPLEPVLRFLGSLLRPSGPLVNQPPSIWRQFLDTIGSALLVSNSLLWGMLALKILDYVRAKQ